jgi:hypothetical protein
MREGDHLVSKESGYLRVHEQLFNTSNLERERTTHRELVYHVLQLPTHLLEFFRIFVRLLRISRLVSDPSGDAVAFAGPVRVRRNTLLDGAIDLVKHTAHVWESKQSRRYKKYALQETLDVRLHDTFQRLVPFALLKDTRDGSEQSGDLNAQLLVAFAILFDGLKERVSTLRATSLHREIPSERTWTCSQILEASAIRR